MAAPTNISSATAVSVGTTLPASVTQTVRDAGVNYTVWYTYTAQPGDTEIGVYAKGSPFSTVDYQPRVQVRDRISGALYKSIDVTNKPLQMPVTPGVAYDFQIYSSTGNTPTTAVLVLSVIRVSAVGVPAGSIAITDDNDGFPIALLSATDATPLQFIQNVPGGEQGIVLPNGTMCISDTAVSGVQIFDAQLRHVVTPVYTPVGNAIISCNGSNKFYLGDPQSGGTPASVRVMTAAGVLGATYTLAATGLTAMAPNLAETILYYAKGTDSAVLRWDLTLNIAMANFQAALANYLIKDIINLADGTFLVSYQKDSVVREFKVLRYNAAGATLNTYTFGADFQTYAQRICVGSDDPLSFWVFLHPRTAPYIGFSTFKHVRVSDGTILATFNHVEFESSFYSGDAVDPPTSRFGHSNSCPIMILRQAIALPAVPVTTAINWELLRFDMAPRAEERF